MQVTDSNAEGAEMVQEGLQKASSKCYSWFNGCF